MRIRMRYVSVCREALAILHTYRIRIHMRIAYVYACVYREALAILHTYRIRIHMRIAYVYACAYREALAILVRREGTAGGVHINGWLSRGKL